MKTRAPKPMKTGCQAFLADIDANTMLAHSAGFEVWHKVFNSSRARESVHAKLFRGDRCVIQWWPAKGTWITTSGKGVCLTFAELLDIATANAGPSPERTPNALDAEYLATVGSMRETIPAERESDWRDAAIAADTSTAAPF